MFGPSASCTITRKRIRERLSVLSDNWSPPRECHLKRLPWRIREKFFKLPKPLQAAISKRFGSPVTTRRCRRSTQLPRLPRTLICHFSQTMRTISAAEHCCRPALAGASARASGKLLARVLLGERPRDLPIAEVAVETIALNFESARNLGINFPTSVVEKADSFARQGSHWFTGLIAATRLRSTWTCPQK